MQTSPGPIPVCNPTVGSETAAMGRTKKRSFFYLEKKLRDSHRLVAALQDALVQSQRKTATDYDLGWCHAKSQERHIWDQPAQQIVSTLSSIWMLLTSSLAPGLSNPPGLYSYMCPPDEAKTGPPHSESPDQTVEHPASPVANEEFDIHETDDDMEPGRRSPIANCYDSNWGARNISHQLDEDDANWSREALLRILEDEKANNDALQASQEEKKLWLIEAKAARDAEPQKGLKKAPLPHRSERDCPTWDSESEYWTKNGCLCDIRSPPEVKFLSNPPLDQLSEPRELLSMPSSSQEDSRPAAKEVANKGERGDRCKLAHDHASKSFQPCGCDLYGKFLRGKKHVCCDYCREAYGCNGKCRDWPTPADPLSPYPGSRAALRKAYCPEGHLRKRTEEWCSICCSLEHERQASYDAKLEKQEEKRRQGKKE